MGNVLYVYILSLSIVIIDLHSMDFWMPRCLLLFKPLLNVPVILIRHNSCFLEVSLIYNCLHDWHLTSKNQGFRVTKDKTMNTINTSAFVSQVLVENMFCNFFFQSTCSSKVTFFKKGFFLPYCMLNSLGHHKTISSDWILCMNMGFEYCFPCFYSFPTVWHCIFHSIPSRIEILQLGNSNTYKGCHTEEFSPEEVLAVSWLNYLDSFPLYTVERGFCRGWFMLVYVSFPMIWTG